MKRVFFSTLQLTCNIREFRKFHFKKLQNHQDITFLMVSRSWWYHQDNGNKNKNTKIKKHQRKIIRFNLPFSKILKTNIGKKFFRFIIRHFSKHHKNMIKLSSYCRNVGSFIVSHNRRVIQPTSNNHGCNCRKTAKCPPDDKCLMTKLYMVQWC